jgi:peptidoglycan/LPS O-acetylase OafA/YrhL
MGLVQGPALSTAADPSHQDSGLSMARAHLPFLDALRGLAILLVFLHHSMGAALGYYTHPWKGIFPDFTAPHTYLPLFPLTLGHIGVAIFFVVSGFCIHLSHNRKRGQSWAHFAWQRFFRIYPPYLLALLVFYLSWP